MKKFFSILLSGLILASPLGGQNTFAAPNDEEVKWIDNKLPATSDQNLSLMSVETVKKAMKFHESFPQYSRTPLVEKKSTAEVLGLSNIFVKDESKRFGLNAFKVLGGSYAMACYMAQKLGCDVSELSYDKLTSKEVREKVGDVTFFTATDGNHGKGVAWTAKVLGQKAVVRMPKGSTEIRRQNILSEGAEVSIEDLNYDECVRKAAAEAVLDKNGVIIQDTAWDGYEEIPTWIMQGYGTCALEACQQIQELGQRRPTHIFIQAGVGSLAGAVEGFFANYFGEDCPKIVVVETQAADCLYRSAVAGDGERQFVTGDMDSIMAGLCCGEPSTISWDILKNHTSHFVSCPDSVTKLGMRMYANPILNEESVISGESGAVTLGLLSLIMTSENLKELKNQLELNECSSVLLFSTEGNTDPVRYNEIVKSIK